MVRNTKNGTFILRDIKENDIFNASALRIFAVSMPPLELEAPLV